MGIKKIDYILAFSQAPIGSDVYLHLPVGFHVNDEDKNETYYLKLKKNLYGTRQEAANWHILVRRSEERRTRICQ